jgi:DNA-binding CsgD family transcriptional regulator
MSEQNVLEEISRKLSVLISLELQRDGSKAVQEHVMHLSRFGLTTGEIAEILDTTAGTVSVAKSRIKRKTGGK